MASSFSSQNQLDGLSPQDMVEMLKAQIDAGVDECLLDSPEEFAPKEIAIEAASTPQPHQFEEASPKLKRDVFAPPPVAPSPKAIQALATQDWSKCQSCDELRQAVSNWSGSDLKKTASNMVFSDGNADADIMIIGDCPGSDEDRQGKPFMGPSGQLLDLMLRAIGLDRSKAYITNLLLWRPPGNRTPTPEEIQQFTPILKRHIELIAPKILVTLGSTPARALLGINESILKQRGKWMDYDLGDGKTLPLMATLNPDQLLSTPGQKSLAWADLRRLHHKLQAI